MKATAGVILLYLGACTLFGCAAVRDAQLTPADGAVAYVREFCQQTPADRAELIAAMDAATKPNAITVRCDGR